MTPRKLRKKKGRHRQEIEIFTWNILLLPLLVKPWHSRDIPWPPETGKRELIRLYFLLCVFWLFLKMGRMGRIHSTRFHFFGKYVKRSGQGYIASVTERFIQLTNLKSTWGSALYFRFGKPGVWETHPCTRCHGAWSIFFRQQMLEPVFSQASVLRGDKLSREHLFKQEKAAIVHKYSSLATLIYGHLQTIKTLHCKL